MTGGDLVTIGALIVAMLGLLVNAWRSSQDGRKAETADVERIVRIDENSRETRADVADIKAELRSVRNAVSDHERRIIVLEQNPMDAHRRDARKRYERMRYEHHRQGD